MPDASPPRTMIVAVAIEYRRGRGGVYAKTGVISAEVVSRLTLIFGAVISGRFVIF